MYFARRPKWFYKGHQDWAVGAAALTLMEKMGERISLGQFENREWKGSNEIASAITHSQSPFLHQRQVRTAVILPATACSPGDSFLY